MGGAGNLWNRYLIIKFQVRNCNRTITTTTRDMVLSTWRQHHQPTNQLLLPLQQQQQQQLLLSHQIIIITTPHQQKQLREEKILLNSLDGKGNKETQFKLHNWKERGDVQIKERAHTQTRVEFLQVKPRFLQGKKRKGNSVFQILVKLCKNWEKERWLL